MIYCGYIGGSSWDQAAGIAVDSLGNAYVTGFTFSSEATFPVTVGPDLTLNGFPDVFVAKVNATGTGLAYAGYIGGSNSDLASGIAVDGSGNAYVTGYTFSSDATFPAVVGPDLTHNGEQDAFVAKVNAAGTALLYAGYIGGSSFEEGFGIAVDGTGNAYVTGKTSSTEVTFPVNVGPDLTYNGGNDGFIAKVNAAGTALVYAGYIGGSGIDEGRGIAVDAGGNAYVAGYTGSTEASSPVAVGPDLTFNAGGNDAFVAKISNGISAGCPPHTVHGHISTSPPGHFPASHVHHGQHGHTVTACSPPHHGPLHLTAEPEEAVSTARAGAVIELFGPAGGLYLEDQQAVHSLLRLPAGRSTTLRACRRCGWADRRRAGCSAASHRDREASGRSTS